MCVSELRREEEREFEIDTAPLTFSLTASNRARIIFQPFSLSPKNIPQSLKKNISVFNLINASICSQKVLFVAARKLCFETKF